MESPRSKVGRQSQTCLVQKTSRERLVLWLQTRTFRTLRRVGLVGCQTDYCLGEDRPVWLKAGRKSYSGQVSGLELMILYSSQISSLLRENSIAQRVYEPAVSPNPKDGVLVAGVPPTDAPVLKAFAPPPNRPGVPGGFAAPPPKPPN